MQGRFSSTDHGLFSFGVFLFPVLHLYFGLSSVLSNLHTNNQGKKQQKKKTKQMKNTTPSPIHCKAWQNTHEIKHLAYASLYTLYHCFPSGFVFYLILFCFF